MILSSYQNYTTKTVVWIVKNRQIVCIFSSTLDLKQKNHRRDGDGLLIFYKTFKKWNFLFLSVAFSIQRRRNSYAFHKAFFKVRRIKKAAIERNINDRIFRRN